MAPGFVALLRIRDASPSRAVGGCGPFNRGRNVLDYYGLDGPARAF
jgi:hypothetical protein